MAENTANDLCEFCGVGKLLTRWIEVHDSPGSEPRKDESLTLGAWPNQSFPDSAVPPSGEPQPMCGQCGSERTSHKPGCIYYVGRGQAGPVINTRKGRDDVGSGPHAPDWVPLHERTTESAVPSPETPRGTTRSGLADMSIGAVLERLERNEGCYRGHGIDALTLCVEVRRLRDAVRDIGEPCAAPPAGPTDTQLFQCCAPQYASACH